MLFPGRIYIARCLWQLGDFCNIFLPNISEDQKVLLSEGGPWHCAIWQIQCWLFHYQRCSRGHKARGQGHKKIKKKGLQNFFSREKGLQNYFSGDVCLKKPKKRSLQIFRKVSGVFEQNFGGLKIVLPSSLGQANFRGLEASRPRPRISKCVLEDRGGVLEDVLGLEDVLEDIF